MGFLTDRFLRGCANRAGEKISAQYGVGPATGILAVSLAHACYPTAKYGDNGPNDEYIGRLRALTIKPCNAQDACKHVERWLSRSISTRDVFELVWQVSEETLLKMVVGEEPDSSESDSGEHDYSEHDFDNLSKSSVLARLLSVYDGMEDYQYITSNERTKFVQILSDWFEKEALEIQDCEKRCIAKFINAELDHVTGGNRGIGRMTENVPRFGAKYRSQIASATPKQIDRCNRVMQSQVLTGYMLAEYISLQTGGKCGKSILDVDVLFASWVPTIFSNGVVRDFHAELNKSVLGKSYRDFFRPVWNTSNAFRVEKEWRSIGVPTSDYTRFLINVYLDAGISLRFCQDP